MPLGLTALPLLPLGIKRVHEIENLQRTRVQHGSGNCWWGEQNDNSWLAQAHVRKLCITGIGHSQLVGVIHLNHKGLHQLATLAAGMDALGTVLLLQHISVHACMRLWSGTAYPDLMHKSAAFTVST